MIFIKKNEVCTGPEKTCGKTRNLFRIFVFIFCLLLTLYGISGCSHKENAMPVLSHQSLGLSDVPNARQIGGYTAAGGRKIKDGIMLRSGALHNASPADISMLSDRYGVGTIIDFRTNQEVADYPDPEIKNINHIHIPVLDEKHRPDNHGEDEISRIYEKYEDTPGRLYVELIRTKPHPVNVYSNYFDSDVSMTAYRKFFDALLSHRNGAILWHCTKGKDRTGLATVMVLSLLGVSEDVILADFALTNEAYSHNIELMVAEASEYTSDPDELRRVAGLEGVWVENMQDVFDLAKKECGSLQKFIQQKVGISNNEVNQLREMYLE